MEEWRAVPGHEGFYEVSSLGRVRSLDRVTERLWKGTPYKASRKGQICEPDSTGVYSRVYLYSVSGRRRYSVHDLVAAAFIGPKPAGHQTCHNDGNTRRNVPDNLRYDTPAGNQADRVRHGTDLRGARHPMRKIGEADVAWMRANRGKCRVAEMAEKFGITESHIYQILNSKSWAHLGAEALL